MNLPAEKLRVAVRIRPLFQKESASNISFNRKTILTDDARYTYDHLYTPKSTQLEVFETSVFPLVDACFEGVNSCVFAYGQTGSGKTYSMLGAEGGHNNNLDGIIPQVANEVFSRIALRQAQASRVLGNGFSQYNVRISFVEVYTDKLRDLLVQTSNTSDLKIFDTGVSGLAERVVTSTSKNKTKAKHPSKT